MIEEHISNDVVFYVSSALRIQKICSAKFRILHNGKPLDDLTGPLRSVHEALDMAEFLSVELF